MRRLVTVTALMALALPAAAQEEPQVLDLEVEGDRLVVADWSHDDHEVRWGIVGHFLWLEWGDPGREHDSLSPNTVSVDVSDTTITQVVAHTDGTVDIIREVDETDAKETPEPESVDVVEEFPSIDWPRLIPAGVRPL